MASGFRWSGMGQLQRETSELELRIANGISAAVDYVAAEGEGRMKVNAPWTDRTTAARSGLNTVTFHELRLWTIVFAHAVNYGIWLETRRDFDGKYAIILPTLVESGQQLMRVLDGLMRKV